MQRALEERRPPGRGLDNLEKELAVVWSAILGVPTEQISATTTFRSLGDEAQLRVLADEIDGEFAVALTVEELGLADTLEGMALLIKDRSRAAYGHPGPPQLIAPGDDDRVPVFCVSGMGARTIEWVRLAELLDPSLKLYAMEAPGFDSRGLPHRRVPAIAA